MSLIPWRVIGGVLIFWCGAGAAPAQVAAKRPNILLAIADDWSREHAGAYGCKWVKTPAFDRVAREGVLFSHAYTANPKCSPARATLLTGRNPWQLEEAINHNSIFPAKFAVYPDVLEAGGYFVGHAGKGWGPGEFLAAGWKRNPAGPEFIRTARGVSRRDYAEHFAEFLAQRPAGQPFCFWYGSFEPHRAYDPGSGRRAGRAPQDVDVPAYYPDSPIIRSDLLDYGLEVEWFDLHLGRMLAQLEAMGELDNTIVVVTSDHGMPFPRAKGQIYEDGYRLPLAVRWGENKGGRVVEDFINLRDIAPTFLELAGLPPHPDMTGRSFADVLRAAGGGWIDRQRNRMIIGKERHDVGRPNDAGYPVRAIRTPEYLYVRNYEPERWPVGNPETGYRNCDDGPTKHFLLRSFNELYRLNFGKRPAEELYRLAADPRCIRNLAGDPALQELKRELRSELETVLRDEGDPRVRGEGAIFDGPSYRYRAPVQYTYDAWLKFQSAAP